MIIPLRRPLSKSIRDFTVGLGAVIFSWASVNSGSAAFITGQEADTTLGNQLTSHNGLTTPASVAVDGATHKVFVAEKLGNRVTRFSSLQALENGSPAECAFGQPDLDHRASGVGPNRLNQPSGCWVDAGGRLWVADSGNHRVLRFDDAANAPFNSSAAAILGQPNAAANTPATARDRMSFPSAVVVDASGRLWVADQNNSRVLRFDNAAAKATNANADGVIGQASYTTFAAGTGMSNLQSPASLAVLGTDTPGDPITLWIGDGGSNRRVLRLNAVSAKPPMGASADAVLGFTGLSQLSQTHFSQVSGLAVDAGGSLYVSDQLQHRVMRFANARTIASGSPATAVLGQPNFTTGTFGFAATAMNNPLGLALDGTRLWIADSGNHRVLRIDNAGTKHGSVPADSFLGKTAIVDPGAITASTLGSPRGVAIDPLTGKVFAADTSNHRVLRWPTVAALESGTPAEAVLGQPSLASNLPATTQAGLNQPAGLIVDSSGRLWVADAGNGRVVRFNNAAHLPNGAPADSVLGQADFLSVQLVTGLNRLNHPMGVAVDNQGRVWVADPGAHRVLRWDSAADKANGSAANGVLGQLTFFSNAAGSAPGQMSSPTGLTVGPNGVVFVADTGNHRVLRFDSPAAAATGVLPDAVYGQPAFVTNAAGSGANGMKSPQALAIDASGRLFVADAGNHRVLWFNKAAQKPAVGAAADGVLGQSDFSQFFSSASLRGLAQPAGLSLDPAGNLWVGDSNNQRIVRFPTLPQEVLACGLAPNGHFCLLFASEPGHSYRIESSTTLQSWTQENIFTASEFLSQWINPGATTGTRFFRVFEP